MQFREMGQYSARPRIQIRAPTGFWDGDSPTFYFSLLPDALLRRADRYNELAVIGYLHRGITVREVAECNQSLELRRAERKLTDVSYEALQTLCR